MGVDVSALAPCVACQFGNHSAHVEGHQGHKGVLGGTYCPCRGECDETVRRARKAGSEAAAVALMHAMSDTVPPVSKPVMVMRSLRVPQSLWEAAKRKADERNENISDVVRAALERYVKRA